MTEATPEPKTAHFKLYREITQRFIIDYKEKDELYRSFQRKVDDFGIAHEKVYIVDRNGDKVHVKDADTLFGIVKDNPKVRVGVRSDDDHSYSSSDSVEHLPGPPDREVRSRTRTRKSRDHSRSKSRDHSRSKSRGHSRSKGRHHSRSRVHYWSKYCPWTRFFQHPRLYPGLSHDFNPYYDQLSSSHFFGLCNFPMDPRMGLCERMHDFDPYFDRPPPVNSCRPTSTRTDPRIGHQEQIRDFDFYSDQPPPFSCSRWPCFPVDPRMGYSSFCGIGRGRGGFHRGCMRGGCFHG